MLISAETVIFSPNSAPNSPTEKSKAKEQTQPLSAGLKSFEYSQPKTDGIEDYTSQKIPDPTTLATNQGQISQIPTLSKPTQDTGSTLHSDLPKCGDHRPTPSPESPYPQNPGLYKKASLKNYEMFMRKKTIEPIRSTDPTQSQPIGTKYFSQIFNLKFQAKPSEDSPPSRSPCPKP
jgi:hypothetical protein